MGVLLVTYKNREGHCNVPAFHKEDRENLGTWLSTQRGLMMKGNLDPEKQKLLEDIGVVWDMSSHQWEHYYNLLVKYKVREGNCNVQRSHEEDGENLGSWLSVQRTANTNGKIGTDKQKKLKDLGVVWDVQKQQWENYYNLLVKYKDREGQCNVPDKHKEDGENLGNWLKHQRAANKKGKLNISQIMRLDAIGVVWDVPIQQWENKFDLLVKYNNREGHCNVPDRDKEDGENLGKWLSRQRNDNKKGTLNVDQIKRLDEIGVVWDVLIQQWENYYILLVKYKDREGHCNVPQIHAEEGKNLGQWLNTQRTAKRKGKLTTDQLKRLDEIGVVWSFKK